jgi:hypothetical protein
MGGRLGKMKEAMHEAVKLKNECLEENTEIYCPFGKIRFLKSSLKVYCPCRDFGRIDWLGPYCIIKKEECIYNDKPNKDIDIYKDRFKEK